MTDTAIAEARSTTPVLSVENLTTSFLVDGAW
jgi:peptide/nickel transport system ATP-binding protein